MRVVPFVFFVVAACSATDTTSTHQAVDSCPGLPPVHSLDTWDGSSLFPATAINTVTLSYPWGVDEFISYGIDVDAQLLVWVEHGSLVQMNGFLDVQHSSVGVAFWKVPGSGPQPGPSGDPYALFAPAALLNLANLVYGASPPRRCP